VDTTRSCLTVMSMAGIGEVVEEDSGRRKEDEDKKKVR
jgi:hypothetical protein